MAKQEIVKRTANLLRLLWWKYMPGTVISVKWPTGWTEADHLGNQTQSSDPNDHYRPWLEQNVGRQGWDWDWRIGGSANYNEVLDTDTLDIKFRKGREQYATILTLKQK